jgi:hypothetical protein
VESGLKRIDEAHSTERRPGIEILTKDGFEPVNFSSGPQLGVPEIELVITNGASRRQDHFGGYLKNGPDLRVTLQFGECYLD